MNVIEDGSVYGHVNTIAKLKWLSLTFLHMYEYLSISVLLTAESDDYRQTSITVTGVFPGHVLRIMKQLQLQLKSFHERLLE